jgi:predicted acetyltransferase
MHILIEAIPVEQKSVLMRLMELYMYDFSAFSGDDVNEHGYYGYSHIDDYWNEEGRYPYLIRADGKIAGFALVRSCCEYNDLTNPHCIAEFFVLRKYRGLGVGRLSAIHVFDLHKGGWEVSQWAKNVPAQKFWRSVINGYTNGRFNSFGSIEEGYVGFTFDNSFYMRRNPNAGICL